MPANETKPFVRTADTKGQGQRYKLGSAFANAGRGLVEAVRGERNLRIDAGFAVIAILLGFALRIAHGVVACRHRVHRHDVRA